MSQLDLSELTFIASLAMGVLVTFRRDLGRWGGRVRIAGTRPEIYAAARLSLEDCAERMRAAVRQFTQSAELQDDQTLLLLRRV